MGKVSSHYTRKVWENTGIRKLWISYGWDGNEFAKSTCVQSWHAYHTCQRGLCAHVSKAFQFLFVTCQHTNVQINVPTCQRRANYSTWRASEPKACQLFTLACQCAKDVPIVQFGVPIFQLCLPKSVPIFSTIFLKNFSIFEFFNYA